MHTHNAKPQSRLYRRSYLRVVLLQISLSALLAVVLFLLVGPRAALAALIGAGGVLIGTLIQIRLMTRWRATPAMALGSSVLGEAFKIGAVIATLGGFSSIWGAENFIWAVAGVGLSIVTNLLALLIV